MVCGRHASLARGYLLWDVARKATKWNNAVHSYCNHQGRRHNLPLCSAKRSFIPVSVSLVDATPGERQIRAQQGKERRCLFQEEIRVEARKCKAWGSSDETEHCGREEGDLG